MGLETRDIEAVSGGSPEENAADLRGIVTGDVTGAKRDIILANAGAAIYVAGVADTHEAGVEQARQAIDSGAAADKLDDLIGGMTRVKICGVTDTEDRDASYSWCRRGRYHRRCPGRTPSRGHEGTADYRLLLSP